MTSLNSIRRLAGLEEKYIGDDAEYSLKESVGDKAPDSVIKAIHEAWMQLVEAWEGQKEGSDLKRLYRNDARDWKTIYEFAEEGNHEAAAKAYRVMDTDSRDRLFTEHLNKKTAQEVADYFNFTWNHRFSESCGYSHEDEEDQYCALRGNTGYRLDRKGETCPNCDEGKGEMMSRDAEMNDINPGKTHDYEDEEGGTHYEDMPDGSSKTVTTPDDDWMMKGGEDGLGPDGEGHPGSDNEAAYGSRNDDYEDEEESCHWCGGDGKDRQGAGDACAYCYGSGKEYGYDNTMQQDMDDADPNLEKRDAGEIESKFAFDDEDEEQGWGGNDPHYDYENDKEIEHDGSEIDAAEKHYEDEETNYKATLSRGQHVECDGETWQVAVPNGPANFVGIVPLSADLDDDDAVEMVRASKLMKKEDEEAIVLDVKMESVKYGVFATGGSVGTNNDKPWKTFDDKEDAKEYAKRARKQLTPGEKGYYKMGFRVRPIKESVQLDEGILQSVFDFMWNATGKALDKMPVVGKKRESARIKKDHEHFKQKMTGKVVTNWFRALESKLKSDHPRTIQASDKRLNYVITAIKRVKEAKSEKSYLENMRKLNRELRDYKKFIRTSNTTFQASKRKKAAKKAANESVRRPNDQEYAIAYAAMRRNEPTAIMDSVIVDAASGNIIIEAESKDAFILFANNGKLEMQTESKDSLLVDLDVAARKKKNKKDKANFEPKTNICPTCEGTGERNGQECKECDGAGEIFEGSLAIDVKDMKPRKKKSFEPKENMCPNCNGKGILTKAEAGPDAGKCKRCDGAGKIFEAAKGNKLGALADSLPKGKFDSVRPESLGQDGTFVSYGYFTSRGDTKYDKVIVKADNVEDAKKFHLGKLLRLARMNRGAMKDSAVTMIKDNTDKKELWKGKMYADDLIKEGAVEATVWDKSMSDKDESPEAGKDDTPKMKTPPKVKSALNKEIKELRTAAKKIETSDKDRSVFYTNCADAMEQISGYLETGTVDSMKDAQIFMTSLMSPIVQRIPDVAYDYITGGGEPAKLKDLFKKVKAKK